MMYILTKTHKSRSGKTMCITEKLLPLINKSSSLHLKKKLNFSIQIKDTIIDCNVKHTIAISMGRRQEPETGFKVKVTEAPRNNSVVCTCDHVRL